MGKGLFAVWTVFVLSLLVGCQTNEQQESMVIREHSQYQVQVERPKKEPIHLQVALIDDRSKNILATPHLSDLGYGEDSKELQKEEVAQLAKSLAEQIDQPMVNPTIDLDGNITEGQSRIILSEHELIEQLMALYYYNKELILPIYETPPTVTTEQLEDIFEVVIGSYTTYFNSGVQGRSKNIQLSAKAIQHHVLGPGDEFSFNHVVGQRTKERGYQAAKEIVNKKFVMGVGGGICQTSTTLFNAIDAAGLEVTERFTHSKKIGYVPISRDATVSWGGPDLKFKNPYEFPVILKTNVSLNEGRIDVLVYASEENSLVALSN